MRIFQLVRREDVSGVSGVGIVAEGVQFGEGLIGKVVLHWHNYGSIAFYDSMEQLIKIHGHDGRTDVLYLADLV